VLGVLHGDVDGLTEDLAGDVQCRHDHNGVDRGAADAIGRAPGDAA
jgi:hypothetical protein